MNKLIANIRMFLWMTCLTGIIYPLFITVIAQIALKTKADGSFVTTKDTVMGSEMIAQKFENDKYFWGRPSAVDYNPLPSGGSNLGPTSAALEKAVEERKNKIAKAHNLSDTALIPAELIFASGSGLDPHISIPTAYFQSDRIAKARNIDREQIIKLIDDQKIKRSLGFLGEEHVNVFLLNKSLDASFITNTEIF